MKRLLFLFTVMAMIIPVVHSQADSARQQQLNKMFANEYYQKGKRQTQTAFVLAGTGVGLGLLGIALFPKDYYYNFYESSSGNDGQAAVASLLFLGGTGLLASSIPCFILGGINKHKARVILRTENVSLSPAIKTAAWQYSTGIAIAF